MESEKERVIIMERSGADGEGNDDQKLQRLFKNLERDWNSVKQPRIKTLRRSSSTDSNTISPTNLMTSLQCSRTPLGRGVWRVRNNELAALEILEERKAAIESGKLKGRRLFEDLEGVTEAGHGGENNGHADEVTCTSGCWDLDLGQESEVRSVFSYGYDGENDQNGGKQEVLCSRCCCHCRSHSSSSSSFLHEDNVKQRDASDGTREKGKSTVFMRRLANALIVCTVILILSTTFGGHVGREATLVPT